MGESFEKPGEEWATDLAKNVGVGKEFKRRGFHESNPRRTQTSKGLESTSCAGICESKGLRDDRTTGSQHRTTRKEPPYGFDAFREMFFSLAGVNERPPFQVA